MLFKYNSHIIRLKVLLFLFVFMKKNLTFEQSTNKIHYMYNKYANHLLFKRRQFENDSYTFKNYMNKIINN